MDWGENGGKEKGVFKDEYLGKEEARFNRSSGTSSRVRK